MKNTYITTAIPYTNAKPHIGHAMDYLLADVYARWSRQQGRAVRISAGTDEHGTKVADKAATSGQTPQQFVDSLQPAFQDLITKLNTPYTDYVRTTSPDHIRRVQSIWQKLAPHIYKSTYTGWYCSGCEAFLTESEAREVDYKCPDHGKPLEQVSEDNYYLRISSFSDQLKQAITSGKMQILPDFRKKEILALIGNQATDVSISRPAEKLSWGIPVPNDPSQTMYVWVDALSNYITALGYPDPDHAANIEDWLPPTLQVVGKDILRFHAIIWPAMLLALGLPLPKTILSHGFITTNGVKMSKSLGNVIDPIEAINRHGTDPFRYYFLRHIPTFDDGDFSWEKFDSAYADELANDLGNLVQRLSTMCQKYGIKGEDNKYIDPLYAEEMDNLDFADAFDIAWNKIRAINKQIDEDKPWEIAKKGDEFELGLSLGGMVNDMVLCGHMLKPFLPETAQKILSLFTAKKITPPETPLFPKN